MLVCPTQVATQRKTIGAVVKPGARDFLAASTNNCPKHFLGWSLSAAGKAQTEVSFIEKRRGPAAPVADLSQIDPETGVRPNVRMLWLFVNSYDTHCGPNRAMRISRMSRHGADENVLKWVGPKEGSPALRNYQFVLTCHRFFCRDHQYKLWRK